MQMLGEPQTWTDPKTGLRYEVMALWCLTSDRAAPAVFQLRGFDDDAAITAAVLRRCLSHVDGWFDESRQAAAEALEGLFQRKRLPAALTAQSSQRPGPGRPREYDDEHFQTIADLYWEATQLGGSLGRKPNVYVLTELRKRKEYRALLPVDDSVALGTVRRWVHRSRELGFLPTPQQIQDAKNHNQKKGQRNAKKGK